MPNWHFEFARRYIRQNPRYAAAYPSVVATDRGLSKGALIGVSEAIAMKWADMPTVG